MSQIQDRQTAAKWAAFMLNEDFCILDTETTGLKSQDEICQISVLRSNGEVLLNTLVRPTVPISPEATAIHGINNAMVADAPTFDRVFILLLQAFALRSLVIYNVEFDLRMIYQSLRPYGIHFFFLWIEPLKSYRLSNGRMIDCAMGYYAQWIGEWNARRGSYTWQRLPGGDHTALGDCKAVLALIHLMAASYDPQEQEQSNENLPEKSPTQF